MPWSFLSWGLRYIIHLLRICKVCWPCVKFHNRIADAWWVTQELTCNVASNSGFPFLIVSHSFGDFLTSLEKNWNFFQSCKTTIQSRVWVWDFRLHALHVTDMIFNYILLSSSCSLLVSLYWLHTIPYMLIGLHAGCCYALAIQDPDSLIAKYYNRTYIHLLHQW